MKRKQKRTPKKKRLCRPPALSVCMIVKDEEKFIGQCLESVKDYADDIVVVDTGSSDRTIEIALRFNARIFPHAWESDFSRHKNQAIGYAAGDWILFIDADEALKPGDGSILRKVVAQAEEEAVFVTIVSFFNHGSSQARDTKERLFRNRPHIRYRGIVHEQLVGYRSARMGAVCLLHYGYDLDKEAMAKKSERTIFLLKRQIEEEPHAFWHRHNLAVAYAADFRFAEAIDSAKKALESADEKASADPNQLWTYYVLSSSSFKRHDLEGAEKYARAAVARCAHHLDSYFMLTLVYHARKDWDCLRKAARSFIETRNRLDRSPKLFQHMMVHSINELWRVRLALAHLHLHHGREEMAEAEFEEALSITPTLGQCYRMMANIYRENGNLDLAENYRQRAWDAGDRGAENLLSLAKIQEEKGDVRACREVIERIRSIDTDRPEILSELGRVDLMAGRYLEAASIFEKIIERFGPEHDALVNLALAYQYSGRPKDAEACNQRALEIQPDSLLALANLGHLFYENGADHAAISAYRRAFEMDTPPLDVSFRLAYLLVKNGDPKAFAAVCDQIFKALNVTVSDGLKNSQDVSALFLLIADRLEGSGKGQLAKEAVKIALTIEPDIFDAVEKDTQRVRKFLTAPRKVSNNSAGAR